MSAVGTAGYCWMGMFAVFSLAACGDPLDVIDDPFYQKRVDADGIPIVGSAAVSDEALVMAKETLLGMLAVAPGVRDALVHDRFHVSVFAESEKLTDLPEFRDRASDETFDGRELSELEGITHKGAVVVAVSEDDLLCQGVRRDESILVHEMGHAVLRWATDNWFKDDLQATFAAAMAAGLWQSTYSASNPHEYWAVGVSIWFEVKAEGGQGNHPSDAIITRKQLEAYDKPLFDLLGQVFEETNWRPLCPDGTEVPRTREFCRHSVEDDLSYDVLRWTFPDPFYQSPELMIFFGLSTDHCETIDFPLAAIPIEACELLVEDPLARAPDIWIRAHLVTSQGMVLASACQELHRTPEPGGIYPITFELEPEPYSVCNGIWPCGLENE